MTLQKELENETRKWLNKIKEEVKSLSPESKKQKEFYRNIKAYISDSEHFLENEKYIEAFEAVIWAWAYLEIARDLEIF